MIKIKLKDYSKKEFIKLLKASHCHTYQTEKIKLYNFNHISEMIENKFFATCLVKNKLIKKFFVQILDFKSDVEFRENLRTNLIEFIKNNLDHPVFNSSSEYKNFFNTEKKFILKDFEKNTKYSNRVAIGRFFGDLFDDVLELTDNKDILVEFAQNMFEFNRE